MPATMGQGPTRIRAARLLLALAALLAALASLPPAAAAAPRTLLVMGDSLSAAYGMAAEEGWVALLAGRLDEREPAWRVVNASISGETTDGGAARIAQAIDRHVPDAVLIELGANDALRGLPLERSRDNLERMLAAAREAGAGVLLAGMRIPPNYGPAYTRAFEAMYAELAQTHDAALLPFLLEPIALDDDAFQADRLHPTAAAQPAILEHVWPALEPVLEAAEAPQQRPMATN